MRHIALAFLCSAAFCAPAFAASNDATVFPPQNCALGQLSLLSTIRTANNIFTSTECKTPLDVLIDAVGPCADGQVIEHVGGIFACATPPTPKTPAIPTCGMNQFLTYNGT